MLISDSTRRAYECDLNKFARWYEETTGSPPDWDSVGPLDIAEFKRYLLTRGQKPSTINRALHALSHYFEQRDMPNPCREIKKVEGEPLPPRWLDRTEKQKFVRAVREYGSNRDYAMVVLMLHCGLRVSEVCSRKVGYVDRDFLKIQGKGEKYREVPLNSTARSALIPLLKGRSSEDWLFPSKRGGPMTPRNLQKLFARYSRLAGIEVTPHDLRHSFCKSLIDAGHGLSLVGDYAGHSSLETTRRYTAPSREELKEAAEDIAWN